jgi:hypothetical protein
MAAEPLMGAARLGAIPFMVLLASCATVAPPAPVPSPQPAAPPVVTSPMSELTAPPAVTPSTSRNAAPPVVTPAPTGASPAKAAPPVAKAPAKVPAPPPQTTKQESIAPAIAKQSPPPLNLRSLEERLKGTNAIGVLTKITLKNQVDDLMDKFRAYYKGQLKATLADLRRSYDMLVLKVLSLLQDNDPSLASAIAASRDAIWGILSDPAKFAAI